MSLEQLMLLASQLAQAPHCGAGQAAATAAGPAQGRHSQRVAPVALSPEELEALRQIWDRPPQSPPTDPGPRVYH